MTDQVAQTHDAAVLARARELLDACSSTEAMRELVLTAVRKNEEWRGLRCINLVAAEAPTSPTVRALLSAEVGTRAAGGHIGPENRCFAGMKYIDEIESLCVELLKRLFRCEYADHRLMGGMAGCHTVYTALTEPNDLIMSVAPPVGGDSSNRSDGPPGARGLRVVDVPFDPDEFVVDLKGFEEIASRLRPKLVGLGLTVALFPFPLASMSEIVREWGGRIYFDGAHQIGLIAGGCYQAPLSEGAEVVTGSGGKTFSGPQSGIILWNDPALTARISSTIFPVLTGSHQVNRVAALAVAATDMLAFGKPYMEQVVRNAKALGAALERRGIPVLCARKGYTETHQIIVDARSYGGGYQTAARLESANIIVNKMLLPCDTRSTPGAPSGIRLGTVEVTRLGLREEEMDAIAEFIARVLDNGQSPANVGADVVAFREPYQTLYFCHENGLPLPPIRL